MKTEDGATTKLLKDARAMPYVKTNIYIMLLNSGLSKDVWIDPSIITIKSTCLEVLLVARAHCSLSAEELPLEAMLQAAFDVPLSIQGYVRSYTL